MKKKAIYVGAKHAPIKELIGVVGRVEECKFLPSWAKPVHLGEGKLVSFHPDAASQLKFKVSEQFYTYEDRIKYLDEKPKWRI